MMEKDKATLEDELTAVIQKLSIWQKKYPRLFPLWVGEDEKFPKGKGPTPEEYEEIQELKAEQNRLKNKLQELEAGESAN